MRIAGIVGLLAAALGWACGEPGGAGSMDLCVVGEVACGENAACDPLDGACYCEPGFMGDPAAGCAPHGELCDEAAARVGHSACLLEVSDIGEWERVSVGSGKRLDVRRVGKYLAPARVDAVLPTLFADTNYYPLHFCLLRDAFAPLLPNFGFLQYQTLVYRRATRSMFAGSIYEFIGADLPVRYGFTVETPDEPAELLGEPEVYAISHLLRERFAVGSLGYVPLTAAQQGKALGWSEPRVPVVIGGEQKITYEVYSAGTAYGRVRRYTAEQAASASESFGWQDILVLETAPSDLVGVMAGVVTGARQDVLSHLNVLAARRGTPNLFVAEPLAAFAAFDGELVRLRATADAYSVTAATPEEAAAYWAANRPSVAIEHPPDPDFRTLMDVHDIPTGTASERGAAVGRFGGKVTGLATLYTILDPVYQTAGFGVPDAHYLDFMASNSWELMIDGAPQVITFADTITLWLADKKFRTDSALRRASLAALASAMVTRGAVDPALRTALQAQIAATFGDPAIMVRFRSSSNVEDGVEFNGAGLYASVSACALDEPDAGGASACDADKSRRSIDSAIKQVWASLWSFGAFEEREYYQIDHARTAMGVLVSLRHEDEQANGVAFTGNPADGKDPRFTINVQAGEVDVVSPPAGVTAELDRLTIVDGEVTAIERAAASSLVPAGEYVLSDEQLRELGAVLGEVQAAYPVDAGDHAPEEVLLDLEFKFNSAGKLVIKQIRPFLPGSVSTSQPTCM